VYVVPSLIQRSLLVTLNPKKTGTKTLKLLVCLQRIKTFLLPTKQHVKVFSFLEFSVPSISLHLMCVKMEEIFKEIEIHIYKNVILVFLSTTTRHLRRLIAADEIALALTVLRWHKNNTN